MVDTTAPSELRFVRKQLSRKRRFEILHRDNFTCQYCGSSGPGTKLHVDHRTAVANGGTNRQDNLVTACDTCNFGKSDRDVISATKPTKARDALFNLYKMLQEPGDFHFYDWWLLQTLLWCPEVGIPLDDIRSIALCSPSYQHFNDAVLYRYFAAAEELSIASRRQPRSDA